jgi:hypothetical protein
VVVVVKTVCTTMTVAEAESATEGTMMVVKNTLNGSEGNGAQLMMNVSHLRAMAKRYNRLRLFSSVAAATTCLETLIFQNSLSHKAKALSGRSTGVMSFNPNGNVSQKQT